MSSTLNLIKPVWEVGIIETIKPNTIFQGLNS